MEDHLSSSSSPNDTIVVSSLRFNINSKIAEGNNWSGASLNRMYFVFSKHEQINESFSFSNKPKFLSFKDIVRSGTLRASATSAIFDNPYDSPALEVLVSKGISALF